MSSAEKRKHITFNPHLLDKESKRTLLLEKIEETVKTGKQDKKESQFPKICLKRFFGKENLTYYVIIKEDKDFIEVITAWKKKGR